MQNVPIALTIAGSDSGGGAGIQADLKAFSALGVYGASVITAVTAQNTQGVAAFNMVAPDLIRAQIDAVLDDMAVGAIKIGMLGDAPTVELVAETLAERARTDPERPPIVLDPVMVATSGDRLLDESAVTALRTRLAPIADLVTPNLPEAAILSDADLAAVAADPDGTARRLAAALSSAVLLKGGHAAGDAATSRDCLALPDGAVHTFDRPRIDTPHTHGTGCTLSAAIAAELAHGRELTAAVSVARDYLHAAIIAGAGLGIGRGRGPVHHFHALWPR
jgi:hydroxymethylpyrimidine/phosphomethylpyrimidine kinase